MILFALAVFHISRQKTVDAFNALLISILDSIWVMASILLLIIDPFQFSTAGNVIITIVALTVLAFALMQVFAIIKINRSSDSGAATQKT